MPRPHRDAQSQSHSPPGQGNATMKISFYLDYHTTTGESLAVSYRLDGEDQQMMPMASNDGFNWQCTVDNSTTQAKTISYHYCVVNSTGQTVRTEWHLAPHMAIIEHRHTHLHDLWHDETDHSPLYASAFTDCLFGHGKQKHTATAGALRLTVASAQVYRNESLRLVGETEALGCWDPAKGLEMHNIGCGIWQTDINPSELPQAFEFKFVAVSPNSSTCTWESRDNRHIALPTTTTGELTVIELGEAAFSSRMPRIAGTVIPVFSLRSNGGCGVGDFGDLKMMIDWVALTGQHILQILPINDTTISHTWADSYPYNSISIYALHPQYTDLRQLPPLKDKAKRKHYDEVRKQLNALPHVDYEKVNEVKLQYLHDAYSQMKSNVVRRASYKAFVKANNHWLKPYATYCHNRDKYGTADHSKWPGTEPDNATIGFWYFVQYILDQQLKSAHIHAQSKGVILKGDIPIGISRKGVEAWIEPKYFNLNSQAGAPPDAFSADGQNWGFSTYNWGTMRQDGYAWWQQRFSKMSEYFDAYRIDHVLGFFRIWDIPANSVTGLLGQFSPAIGMTKEEIESYGILFDESRMCNPLITDDIASQLLGEWADEAKARYMTDNCNGTYSLKEKYATQRAIECDMRGDDARSTAIRSDMYAIISNVLFVHDRNDHNRYHPRIALHHTTSFAAMDQHTREALLKLHDDYFYRRHNDFWRQEAMQKLPALTQCTRMLPCAEDLGMVPECVPQVMSDLKILTLEIQHMPKKFGFEFSNLAENPYLSVSTISTHDMPPLRQWWDENPVQAQRYYNNVLGHNGDAPHPLPAGIAKEIVSAHLGSPSMLCLLSLQDWLSIDENLRNSKINDERINIPANPHHYWKWRMHLTIEDLTNCRNFNSGMSSMIKASGRDI